jgi:hypothetical protein
MAAIVRAAPFPDSLATPHPSFRQRRPRDPRPPRESCCELGIRSRAVDPSQNGGRCGRPNERNSHLTTIVTIGKHSLEAATGMASRGDARHFVQAKPKRICVRAWIRYLPFRPANTGRPAPRERHFRILLPFGHAAYRANVVRGTLGWRKRAVACSATSMVLRFCGGVMYDQSTTYSNFP